MKITNTSEPGKFEAVYFVNGNRYTKIVDEDYARMLLRAVEYGKKVRSREIRALLEE